MELEFIAGISAIETVAVGSAVRKTARRRRMYGQGRWCKRTGIARARPRENSVRAAEIHWYEASGIGRKELQIKYLF